MLGDNQEAGITLVTGPPEFRSPSAGEQLGLGILFILIAPIGAIGSFIVLFWLMAVVAWSPKLGSFDMQVMFFIMLAAFGTPVFFFVRWCVRKIARASRR
jgi:hypothetical protein